MGKLKALWVRLQGTFHTNRAEAELSAELESHLQMHIDDGFRNGLSEAEARRQALMRLGGMEQAANAYRERRGFPFLETLVLDVRYGIRQIRKTPGFSLIAILTLALGTGATTTIFSIIDGVLLKPLNYRDSGQLVAIWERVRFIQKMFPYVGPNPRHAQLWEQQATDFSGITLLQTGTVGVSVKQGNPRYVGTFTVQPNFLDVLGIQPAIGRNFLPSESVDGKNSVAIISWHLWQTLLRGDRAAIGKTIVMNKAPITIVGVLPENAYLPKAHEISAIPRSVDLPTTEILIPQVMNFHDLGWNSDYGDYVVLGRLKSGVTISHAQSQLSALQNSIARLIPAGESDGPVEGALGVYVQPLKEVIVAKTSLGLYLLLAAVFSVLAIACVNLANAQIARFKAKDRESAMRVALGASAMRLIQSAFVEVALLSLIGGVLGVILAVLSVGRVVEFSRLALARTEDIAINPLVLAFCFCLTVGSSVLSGLLPALRMLKVQPQAALQDAGNRVGLNRNTNMRRVLVGIQIFACTTLLLTSGLFISSLLRLNSLDKGFQSEHVLVANVDLHGDFYNPSSQKGFHDAVLERLRALPGVQAAGIVNAQLMNGQSNVSAIGQVHGKKVLSNYRWISPGYFEAIQQKILQGRALEEGDRTKKNVLISKTTAKTVFPNEEALGRQVSCDSGIYTVVGIASDARNTALRDSTPVNMAYLGYWERPPRFATFLVRGDLDMATLADEVRKVIWGYDPTVTIADIKPLNQQIKELLTPERLEARVLIALGGAALLVSMLGIYGTLSYAVSTRKKEMGIRMALGATHRDLHRAIAHEIFLPLFAGLALGWLASFGIERSLKALLYEAHALDPVVSVSMLLLLLLAAILAALVPCLRAGRVQPIEALRTD